MACSSKLENNNFYQIKAISTISNDILDVALNDDKWGMYFDFLVKKIDDEIIVKDNFLKILKSKLDFNCYVLQLLPHTIYNWHKDTKRLCSINMLVNFDGISHCIFSNKHNDIVFNFVELNYKPNNYYVFNTQNYHQVLNFDKPRYLLSLEFKDATLNYLKILEIVKNIDDM